jgi:hypothetical protein
LAEIRFVIAMTLSAQGRMPRAKMATPKRIWLGWTATSQFRVSHDVYSFLIGSGRVFVLSVARMRPLKDGNLLQDLWASQFEPTA